MPPQNIIPCTWRHWHTKENIDEDMFILLWKFLMKVLKRERLKAMHGRKLSKYKMLSRLGTNCMEKKNTKLKEKNRTEKFCENIFRLLKLTSTCESVSNDFSYIQQSKSRRITTCDWKQRSRFVPWLTTTSDKNDKQGVQKSGRNSHSWLGDCRDHT